MNEGRIVGGCGGDFPEPEVKKIKKEKACCHGGCVQCGGETGCGLGPVKEGSAQDASGSSDLLQENKTQAKTEYLIVTQDGEYLINLEDDRHDENIQTFVRLVTDLGKFCNREQVTIFGLKRNEPSYRYHHLRLDTIIRIIPWDVEKWKVETSEGIV